MKIFLSFLLNALILLEVEAYQFNDETDKQALLDFKSQVSEVQRTVLSSWNNSNPLCNWTGVTCGRKHKRVTGLDLGGLNLGGVISPSIGNLSFLVLLNLEENSFVGTIPQEIGNLFRLQVLNMGSNLLIGEIPTSLSNCSRLSVLDLFSNRLENGVPPSFGKLKNLHVLSLLGNSLGNYSSGDLEFLEALTNCTKLEYLDVGENRLGGHLPASISNLSTNLNYLSIHKNQISGNIPYEIGNLINLETLWLEKNMLRGSLPASLGKLSSLIYLDVAANRLSGEIPSSIGNLTQLAKLYLFNNSFEGMIPPSIRHCNQLQFLNIGYNQLSGTIPTYLASFLNLQYLDLSFNNLEGKVPTEGIFKNVSVVSVLGNKDLCGGIKDLKLKPCSEQALSMGTKHSSHVKTVATAISLSILVLLFIGLVSLYWFRKRNKNQPNNAIPSGVGEFHEKISYAELRNATDGFSSDNIIGSGSFGIVFKAILPSDNKVVAVKVLKLQRKGAMKSFLAECGSLKDIRHRNLVKLLTVCSRIDSQRNEFRALVYEFMSNGSLDMWLHPEEIEEIYWPLTLFERLNIAIDVASALEYLHVHCHEPIAHCDLKPSNVLLDDDLTAHVSDFGLARLLLKFDQNSSFFNQLSSAGVRGTIGYAAPEYGMGAQPSIHGDVYSFGVLILEMFTGKRPTNDLFGGSFTLYNYTKSALPERVLDITDKSILESSFRRGFDVSECLTMIFQVGLKCCQESRTNRMTISEAVRELISIKEKFFKAIRTSRAGHFIRSELF